MKYLRFMPVLVVVIILSTIFFYGFITLRNIFDKPSYTINVNGPAVVKQLQALNRYETASFTIEKVIDAGTSGNALQELLYGDKILLIAHGQVIAGFDLSKLLEQDIQLNTATVRLNLPSPQIILTQLDSQRTRVYDRKLGILTRGDKDLETKARTAAEQSLQKAACEGNILDEASKNARTQLTTLLKTLGFVTVIINIPQASC